MKSYCHGGINLTFIVLNCQIRTSGLEMQCTSQNCKLSLAEDYFSRNKDQVSRDQRESISHFCVEDR